MSARDGICQDCRHFAALETQCRVGEPTAFLIINAKGEPRILGGWAQVQATHWCGKFERDPLSTRQ